MQYPDQYPDDMVHVPVNVDEVMIGGKPFVKPWNAKQAAAFLGMSRRHTYDLARAGVLPATKRGRKWYFSPEKLREWVGV